MSAQTETSQSGVLDTIKLLIAAVSLVGGLYAYYYFESDFPQAVRVLMVLGGTAAGIAIAMTSMQGQRLWHFIQGSRVEIRKVVWPTKQETTQTAIAVFVFTLVHRARLLELRASRKERARGARRAHGVAGQIW
jgi:preprotein translocase subunit SecE